ncbi:hypothetical protein EYC80_005767 [Monilinia laxa]|uniref:Uncharacterized protein n=1 Tax=Monilinia laxa TaxID=61186 RepID=A0A5N6KEX5_MONLA|nr:hypothetical protein EYC80_005767 [Monilinia laxa]
MCFSCLKILNASCFLIHIIGFSSIISVMLSRTENLRDCKDQLQFEDVRGKTAGSNSYSNLKISFERSESSNSTLEHCTEAFGDIISQCIMASSPGTYGGGSSFDNGETYTIINELYPQEPIISANLEDREVEISNKKPPKAIPKATHKTTPKANSKTKQAPATTNPKKTQTTPKKTETQKTATSKTTENTPKSTETPKAATQSIPTTSKSSMAKPSSSPETPKTPSASTNSKTTETALTTLLSTNSKILQKRVFRALTQFPRLRPQFHRNQAVLPPRVPWAKAVSSINSSSVTPTEFTSITSSAVSSHTQEPASSIHSSSAGSSVKPSSVIHSDSSSKLTTPASKTSSHIVELFSTHPISNSIESTAVKTSSRTSTTATGIHTSSVPSGALSSGSPSSRSQSTGSSISMAPFSSGAHTFESTPVSTPKLAPVSATSPKQTGSLLSETNTGFKSSAVSSPIPEVTPGPSVIMSSALASSTIVESSNLSAQSSNFKETNAVQASSITPGVSSESLTPSVQPEITPPPFTSSNLVSGAVPSASESEPTSHATSRGSLTNPAQSEITPSPLDPSISDSITSTSGPGFFSQALSIGSLAFSVVTELAPSPTDLPSSGTITPSSSEATDPSETFQPESSPTDTALISPTLTSSPACSVTTAGNCSACYQYSGSGDVSSSNNTNLKTRDLPPSIAGRISTSHLSPKLSKRVARSFTSFDAANSCVFSLVEIPSIPDPSNLVSEAGPQTQYWYVLQDTSANGTTCPVLGFTKITDEALASHLISSNAVGYTKAALGISWKVNAPTVNVDSVYEPSILQEFFASKVTSNNCASFKAIFDQPDAGNGGTTRLQDVWNQLPSDTNPDFAGMDQKISTIKAQAFQGDSQHTCSSNDEKLAYISELAVTMTITNNDDIASTFKGTNLRIYQALLDIDAVIGAANTTAASLLKPDWASAYRTYLANLLTTRSSAINSQVSSYLNNDLGPAVRSDNITLPDGTISTTENSIGNGVDAFLRAYPMPDSFTFDQEKLLGFPGV